MRGPVAVRAVWGELTRSDAPSLAPLPNDPYGSRDQGGGPQRPREAS